MEDLFSRLNHVNCQQQPDVIQKNKLYFCNQGSNVIQNQLSKSKHRLKSFVVLGLLL
jgi:hypothetical protein